jgi:hypothetical protein
MHGPSGTRQRRTAGASTRQDKLVEGAHHWPGVSSLDALMHGKTLVASRPRHFFRDEGGMPDVVSLSISRPTAFKDLSPKGIRSDGRLAHSRDRGVDR